MNVRPIAGSLPGEHVLVVEPRPAFPSVDAGWTRRLRIFQGRSLDANALTSEQDSRASKLAVLGQTRSPGIVTGLDVSLEHAAASQVFLHVSPGLGLLPSGEDVVLGHELRIAPSALGAIDNALRAAILIAVPVTTRIAGRFDPEDPCEIDESEEAFADEQRVDALQLELLPWDATWAVLDATSARRNQLAYTIFELERALPFGEIAPWQRRGLPLALVGLDSGAIAFVDRHAIARRGGDPLVRSPLVAPGARVAGTPALWQARILQLADHLADLRTAGGSLPAAQAAQLSFLPPAGVIPRDAVAVMPPLTNQFFPPAWRLRATALPREQLDGVLARAASLAPLSTTVSEEVMLIVPVPQAVYEPHLLEIETVSSEFQTAIDQMVVERTDWLGRRVYLRHRRDALLAATDPSAVVPYPDPDPDRLEDEPAATEVSSGESAFDTQLDGTTLRSIALMQLKTRLDGNTSLVDEDKDVYGRGLLALIDSLQKKISAANDAIDFGFLRAQSDIYRLRQLMLGNQLGTKLATSPALATIAKGATATAVRDDLSSLYTTLKKAPTTPAPAGPTRAPIAGGSALASAVFARPLTLGTTSSALRIAEAAGVAAQPGPSVALGATGITATKGTELAVARTLEGTTTSTVLHVGGVAAIDDITEGSAVVGAAEFRNVTVAERIDPPPAGEGRQFAVASRHEALQSIDKLDALKMKVSDIAVFSVPKSDGTRIDTTFGAIKTGTGGIDSVLTDPPPASSTEEASFFHDTVSLVEAHIGTLRGLEGRVAQYRAVLQDCQTTLAAIQGSISNVDARIATVQHQLEDARHAVATARSLLAEETARVDRINTTRASVLATYVDMLAYVRPRFFECLTDVPELALDPALLESPVPACLGGHDDAPPEIAEMVALLREAPLQWFRLGPPILKILDRVELLHGLMVTARTRSVAVADNGLQSTFLTQQLSGRFGPAISAVGRAQVDAIWQPRAQVASFDVRKLAGLSWIESRDVAQQVASLGDLIEGDHRRRDAVAQAHAVIANIEKVAGCLWAQTGAVLPAIRLAWAEKLDEYQGHVVVNLPALPRWREVPFTTRKTIEELAEWLIEQIDRTIPAAVSWMHDLVRACILLASHAPVDQIIAGDVPVASPAGPGHLVPVIIDPVRVRIGMHVTFFQGSNAVAHGVVEDLLNDRARARIADATTPQLRLDAGTRARFAIAGSPAAPLTRELA
jgi:hypothetical protein